MPNSSSIIYFLAGSIAPPWRLGRPRCTSAFRPPPSPGIARERRGDSLDRVLLAKMASNGAANDEELILKERAKSAFRYTEDIAPGYRIDVALHSILHTSLSPFQEVHVIDSYFGRTLVTDGKTQSTEHDEFVYHESLVHPPLFWSAILSGRDSDDAIGAKTTATMRAGAAPKSVFIGGGGELATAREVLRHNSIERVVMVDIDPVVIDVCKK